MSELDTGRSALAVDEGYGPSETINVDIIPETQIAGGDSSAWKNSRRFRHHKPSATDSTTREMDEMPIVHESVLCGVLAHWRYHDPVGQRDCSEVVRSEEMGTLAHGMDVQ
jgi:hypothetical protein